MIHPQDFPRYSGIATFMRVPYVEDLDDYDDDVDVAFVGTPWDSDATYRAGARFGPRAVREASTLLKPYNPLTETNLMDYALVDNGDVFTIPGYTEDSMDLVEEQYTDILDRGVIPATVSNDLMPLPILRALAAEHGPISMVHFDAHPDLWTSYFGKDYNHGTWVHHAIEEGILDTDSSIRVGDRGPLYNSDDPDRIDDSGIEYYTMDEFDELGPERIGERIIERADGPVYVNLDIDSIDPAYAPGTGAPEPGGFTTREMFQLLQPLETLDIKGMAVVEVCPPYDDQSNSTSILAANLLWHLIHLTVS